jgi:purine-binding chemotaxis protein CheW
MEVGRPHREVGVSVLCKAGAWTCALPLACVTEVMRPLPVEALGGAPAAVLGLAIVRGRPTAVVDLGRVLGRTQPLEAGRFVAIRVGDRTVALAVEAVLGVRSLPAAEDQLPPLLRDSPSSELIAAVGTQAEDLFVVLRASHVVPESLWAVLDGEGTA